MTETAVESRYCEERRWAYGPSVSENPLKSVGLGGDGDELFAIADVERAFHIKLDYADAPRWLTADDLFASVEKALPPEERGKPELWKRFAAALGGQTGVDPKDIGRDSPLLSESRFWARLADASAAIWIVTVVSFVIVIAVIALARSQCLQWVESGLGQQSYGDGEPILLALGWQPDARRTYRHT